MIVKIDEIGKTFQGIMKEKQMSARVLSIRTGIAESSLSNFFHDMSFKRCFHMISELARVFNLTSITIIFDKSLSEKDFQDLPESKDYFDTTTLLPEYKKEFLKIVEKNEEAKRKIENIKKKNI